MNSFNGLSWDEIDRRIRNNCSPSGDVLNKAGMSNSVIQPRRIATCLVLSNFCVAVFDAQGRQIPDLQMSLLSLWAERAEKLGYPVEGLLIETPKGSMRLCRGHDARWGAEFLRVRSAEWG